MDDQPMRQTSGQSWAAFLLVLAFAACGERTDGREPSASEPLLVLAASNLDPAMSSLAERFRESSGTEIDVVFGATGNLAAQIENGAPADVFFSADESTVERLATSGSLRASSIRAYAVGQLVLVWREGVTPPESLAAAASDLYEVVAIANPEFAPYGAAARETLEGLGIWEAIEPRIVLGENIAQTYQLVQTGNADLGFVARSIITDTTAAFAPVDPSLHRPIRQAAAVLERSVRPEAGAFLAFVLSEDGQSILSASGFGKAEP